MSRRRASLILRAAAAVTAAGLVAAGVAVLPVQTATGQPADSATAGPAAASSGTIASTYLSLDQAMVLGAIGNQLVDDVVKRYFVDRPFRHSLRPLMAMEHFTARP